MCTDYPNVFILYEQEYELERIASTCQRQARVRRTYHVCLCCERRGRMAAPRLCSRTFQTVCQNCQDRSECIPAIDMVGRVVTVQNKQLYLAPCCARIQEYTGTGRDFASREHWNEKQQCQHTCRTSEDGAQSKVRKVRHSCFVWNCQAQAAARVHRVVDHLQGCMESVHLCYKHTPPEELLKRVKNFKQLCDTCYAWDKRQKNVHKKKSFYKKK